ncbi:MAG: hypothetical protein QOE69_1200 [Thermoleophilaceae bacterium]|jgi:hypothetical protein|nr:hypothetical protein [Thermoleophilaceae bacterium]
MAWESSLLVVANVTAESDELLASLRGRAAEGACRFTLVMPASGAAARTRLDGALERMREAGLANVDGSVGDPDPVVAVMEIWDPMKFDEVIVSTLPTGSSRWLGLDLPHRLEKLTSVPVRHVVSQPRREVRAGPPPEKPARYGVLAALAAMIKR